MRLDKGFHQSPIEHPPPTREVGIRAVSDRSMAIGLCVWLAYRLHALERPTEVSWPARKAQFGEGYKELRFFRRDVLPSVSLALAACPEAHVVVDEKRGRTLYRSAPPSRRGSC